MHDSTATPAEQGAASPQEFHLVVLGGGSAAEELCESLARRGGGEHVPFPVAVVEENFVGGACPFLACMPSKALLASAAARRALATARRRGASGHDLELGDGAAAYAEAAKRRDQVAEERDDSGHAAELEKIGVTLLRGRGVVRGWGRAEVLGDGAPRQLSWRDLVVATGSAPAPPPLAGLDSVPWWSSEEALSARELPGSLAILGAGPVGCELAEALAAFLPPGRVVLVEGADRPLAKEEPSIGKAVAAHLSRHDVDVRLGVEAERAVARGEAVSLLLSDGSEVEVERLIVATGRKPRSEELGLESLGIAPGELGAVEVDDELRAGHEPGGSRRLFAVGDVNGKAPFTHAAKYQARVVAALLSGERARVDGRGVPRCVYTDPPVAAVGLTERAAREQGIDCLVAAAELGETARAQSDGLLLGPAGEGSLDERAGGHVVLVADRARQVLIGAAAFGPRAEEWVGELTLAVRGELPLALLAEVVHPFPSYAEALGPLLEELARKAAPG